MKTEKTKNVEYELITCLRVRAEVTEGTRDDIGEARGLLFCLELMNSEYAEEAQELYTAIYEAWWLKHEENEALKKAYATKAEDVPF